MPSFGPRQLRAVRAAAARCLPGRRCSTQERSSPPDSPVALVNHEAGEVRGAAPLASLRRRGGTLLRRAREALGRLRDHLPRHKRPAASGCAPINHAIERQPALQYQEHSLSLVPERQALVLQQSLSAQPEVKQRVIDSKTVVISQLQCEVAALRQRALHAEQQLLPHHEDQARSDLRAEADNELTALMLASHAPRSGSPNDGHDTGEPADVQGLPHDDDPTSVGGAELVLPDMATSRSPTHARKCLFIDVICHWVSSFVYRDWACVCSAAAQAVYRVLLPLHGTWTSTALLLGSFQSVGFDSPHDTEFFGPEPGPLVTARDAVLDLRKVAVRTDVCNEGWRDHFLLHMQITAHLYEEMRLCHRQVFITAAYVGSAMDNCLTTLEQTLEMRTARLAAAAEHAHEGATDVAAPGAES